MHECLDARDERHRSLVLGAQLAHLEDVVGADLDAVFLALASIAIDGRREDSRVLLAFDVRRIWHGFTSERLTYSGHSTPAMQRCECRLIFVRRISGKRAKEFRRHKTLTILRREHLMADYDIQIKGGTIVDGTRVPRYHGDVWIKDGKVAQLGGRAPGFAKKVIDADGLIVAPGFVDLHTHYDAQIRWDPYCTISGWHGVTSLVLGNCGFGFAPCKPDFRERSMLTMTRTEAIPYASMKAGINWDWETIPQYMDSLDRAPKGINCIQYMPTASLMTYVMGLEAAKSRPANEKERAEMARLLDEGMDAGLCGFSIQRLGPNSVQADCDGSPMVTDTMCDEDILNLARVL